MMKEQEKGEQVVRKRFIPVGTILIAGTSLTVYWLWNRWTYQRAHRSFVFSEMNVLNLGNA